MRVFILLLVNLLASGHVVVANPALDIFDGHIHHSRDVWVKLSPQRARELLTEAGKLTSVWYELMTDFHTRFLAGMDTYTPGRWVELPELAAEARGWSKQLPDDVAHNIAYGNAARLFPVKK